MSKVNLNDVASFQNDTTAVNTVNTNSATIETAFDNTLSRDGTQPNTMGANLDMNGNQILNLPAPASVNSPARLVDVVTNPTIVIPGTGTSGHLVPFLDGNNTWSGTNTYPVNDLLLKGSSTGVTALNSANASGSNFVATLPAATDTITLNAAAQTLTNKTLTAPVISTISNTGTITLPTSTDTLVGKATTDTFTNKTFNSAGTGNTLQVSGVTVSRGQLPGTSTNDSATAGNIGEKITSNVPNASAVSLTTGVGANVTSISLTAGDWDVWGVVFGKPAGTSTTSFAQAAVTTTSATIPSDASITTSLTQVWMPNTSGTGVSTAGGSMNLPVAPITLSLSGTTTVFLVTAFTFGVSTYAAYGTLWARRVR